MLFFAPVVFTRPNVARTRDSKSWYRILGFASFASFCCALYGGFPTITVICFSSCRRARASFACMNCILACRPDGLAPSVGALNVSRQTIPSKGAYSG